MIFKSLHLYIDELGPPPEYTYSFKKRSRFICNWIEREVLKPLHFRADFKRLVVNLVSAPKPNVLVNSSDVARVEIPFDRKVIDSAEGIILAHLQIDMLRTGIEKCALSLAIPKTELLGGLNAFVAQGMNNEWLYKRRIFKSHQLTATLNCKMTQELFLLRLTVWHREQIVFDAAILETDPDEVAFHHKFDDIEVSRGNLVVTDKFGDPRWIRSLESLTNSDRG